MAIRLYPGNIHDLIEESSGSRSGVPRIVQQTICKQIDMGQHPKFDEQFLVCLIQSLNFLRLNHEYFQGTIVWPFLDLWQFLYDEFLLFS